ncbi:MAG: NCS1 family nucleobase:cation symporter-1 [Gemmatimonadaceae bacterium]
MSWLPPGIAPDLGAPSASRYFGADLAPVSAAERSWGLWHYAALWVAMSVCIPTYMLAAALIQAGLTWQWALAAILLGNAIVLVPLLVNGHAGTRYGIPFPVYVRAAFGLRGAHVPSLLRAIVACGWFGIQTWVGGLAIHEMISLLWPAWASVGGGALWMGYGLPHFLAFLLFWTINIYFVWAGTESIKWLETAAAPLLIVAGLALLWWAQARVGGFGTLLGGATSLGDAPGRFSAALFIPWVTAMVGFWATLALSIPDFTRYARSQRDQALGQTIGLLTTMPLFAFIGVAVTSATVQIYGEAIWNPVTLIARIAAESGSTAVALIALLVLLIATLTTNIAANVVAPAAAIANLRPSRISQRLGGIVAATVGIALFPWRLLDAYQTWLLSYSGLLGAVGGVIVCDYLVVRRGVLDVAGLFTEGGPYWYHRGVNLGAMTALGAGVAVALLGAVVPALHFLFSGAWFSAAIVSFVVHWWLARRAHLTFRSHTRPREALR